MEDRQVLNRGIYVCYMTYLLNFTHCQQTRHLSAAVSTGTCLCRKMRDRIPVGFFLRAYFSKLGWSNRRREASTRATKDTTPNIIQ